MSAGPVLPDDRGATIRRLLSGVCSPIKKLSSVWIVNGPVLQQGQDGRVELNSTAFDWQGAFGLTPMNFVAAATRAASSSRKRAICRDNAPAPSMRRWVRCCIGIRPGHEKRRPASRLLEPCRQQMAYSAALSAASAAAAAAACFASAFATLAAATSARTSSLRRLERTLVFSTIRADLPRRSRR